MRFFPPITLLAGAAYAVPLNILPQKVVNGQLTVISTKGMIEGRLDNEWH